MRNLLPNNAEFLDTVCRKVSEIELECGWKLRGTWEKKKKEVKQKNNGRTFAKGLRIVHNP